MSSLMLISDHLWAFSDNFESSLKTDFPVVPPTIIRLFFRIYKPAAATTNHLTQRKLSNRPLPIIKYRFFIFYFLFLLRNFTYPLNLHTFTNFLPIFKVSYFNVSNFRFFLITPFHWNFLLNSLSQSFFRSLKVFTLIYQSFVSFQLLFTVRIFY
jgi:hypothetical protein